jgi:hypothetical protein
MINSIYKYALIASVFFTIACQQDNSLKPNPFFDRDKMAAILTDIQIVEAGINQQGLVIDSINKSMLWHYEYVYKKHNITEKQFNDNYTYYLEEPIQLDSVYNDVIKNIAKLISDKK